MTVFYMATLHEGPFHLRMRNVLDKFEEKIKTNFVSSNIFPENRAVYEMMWKNVVERDRPQISI